eukprot:scaffold37104_cov183-Amphora_coffeaeformis.AAC.1
MFDGSRKRVRKVEKRSWVMGRSNVVMEDWFCNECGPNVVFWRDKEPRSQGNVFLTKWLSGFKPTVE